MFCKASGNDYSCERCRIFNWKYIDADGASRRINIIHKRLQVG